MVAPDHLGHPIDAMARHALQVGPGYEAWFDGRDSDCDHVKA
jgi:hypothetical protein